MWGSEFTTEAATPQGGSEEFALSPFVVAFVPVFFLARMAHEVVRAEELAERRLRVTAPITPGSRSKSTARTRTRTLTNSNPNDTEASAAGSGEYCGDNNAHLGKIW